AREGEIVPVQLLALSLAQRIQMLENDATDLFPAEEISVARDQGRFRESFLPLGFPRFCSVARTQPGRSAQRTRDPYKPTVPRSRTRAPPVADRRWRGARHRPNRHRRLRLAQPSTQGHSLYRRSRLAWRRARGQASRQWYASRGRANRPLSARRIHPGNAASND